LLGRGVRLPLWEGRGVLEKEKKYDKADGDEGRLTEIHQPQLIDFEREIDHLAVHVLKVLSVQIMTPSRDLICIIIFTIEILVARLSTDLEDDGCFAGFHECCHGSVSE